MTSMPMTRSNERGVALVLVLFMTMIVSAIAAGMAYTARTETLSSQSYTTMTHARCGVGARGRDQLPALDPIRDSGTRHSGRSPHQLRHRVRSGPPHHRGCRL